MARLELTDSSPSIFMKMSEGNPGAISVLLQCAEKAPTIDPSNLFGGLYPVLLLDSYGVYGPNIWVLYKDVCGEHIGKMIAVLRSVQLGITPEYVIQDAIAMYPYKSHVSIDIDHIVSEVQKKIPNFNVED